MAIHIIIDGYNLIRQSPELSGLDRQDLQLGRDALVDVLAAYKKIKPHKISVVFDGTAGPSLYGSRDRVKGIAIRYSQGGESADDVIRRMARREKAQALVVSSDREVMTAAESAGATVMDSAAFEDKIAMARYLAVKGGGEPVESVGWVPTTRKKGPSRRLPKRKRKARARVEKL
ncbi:MAG: NYN domain-containing protein [Desulfosarcina sp.]|nr:NYN domain-containing protein [Desulfosarcina sp.]MBC2744040.1 NYN domain-containing protein [Desulfosarcina sp.]MBC2766949.1 NYN domain-containing protein [Desulfosarcina sp.]